MLRVIRKPGESRTIGFKDCVQLSRHEPTIRCLSEGQEITLLALNGWRDAAQHYLLKVSEQQLYVALQGAVTLFEDLMASVFDDTLSAHVPSRVLPVSTEPPKDLTLLLDDEFALIRELVRGRSRMSADAKAHLRTIAILDIATTGSDEPPTDEALDQHLAELRAGRDWRDVFPGVARLELSTTGSGLNFSVRISKREGMPVRIVDADSPDGAGAPVILKTTDELGWYCFGYKQLVKRHGLGFNKARPILEHLGIMTDPKYTKVFDIAGGVRRYSQAADQLLGDQLPTLDVDAIWADRRRPRG